MNILHAFLLGIIQGLTEFIPISSTAHLLIGQKMLGLPSDDAIFSFLVIVQLGTILSLVIYFWHDLVLITKAFFARPFSTPENKLAWYILIATLPALIAGYLLKDLVETLFRTPLLEAGIRLLISAALLSLAEWLGKRSRGLMKITWLDALIIGLAQVVSVFPGASRSGTTISAGMLCDFDRKSAARFGFLMSIPVMMVAGGYEMLDVVKMLELGSFLPILAVGLITSAIIGWLAVKWLLGYLEKHSLYYFAIYCTIVGLAVLIVQVF